MPTQDDEEVAQEGFIWTPEPGELARVRDSVVTSLTRTVTVEAPEDPDDIDPITGEPVVPPQPTDFSVSGLPSIFSFTTSENSFTIHTSAIPSLFPIRITYLQTKYANSESSVTAWPSIPSSAKEMVKLETLATSPYAFTFSVTASNGIDTETESYSVVIIHSYTANKLALQDEVNKRR